MPKTWTNHVTSHSSNALAVGASETKDADATIDFTEHAAQANALGKRT